MSATYNVVSLGGNEYEVFADLATADTYLAAEPHADLWREGDAEANGRADVSATRILNRMRWPGTKADADQALAWPRSGTALADVDEFTIPQPIIDASIELANAIRNGYDASNQASTASGVRRQKAGSVEIEYFASVSIDGYRLPLPVMELIGPYLGGEGSLAGGAIVSGTCGRTIAYDDFEPSGPL